MFLVRACSRSPKVSRLQGVNGCDIGVQPFKLVLACSDGLLYELSHSLLIPMLSNKMCMHMHKSMQGCYDHFYVR